MVLFFWEGATMKLFRSCPHVGADANDTVGIGSASIPHISYRPTPQKQPQSRDAAVTGYWGSKPKAKAAQGAKPELFKQ